jgi:hypothetical protein
LGSCRDLGVPVRPTIRPQLRLPSIHLVNRAALAPGVVRAGNSAAKQRTSPSQTARHLGWRRGRDPWICARADYRSHLPVIPDRHDLCFEG